MLALGLATPQGAQAAAGLVVGDGSAGVDEESAGDELTPAKAAVLGVVEGVTEYLPISSTGHLLVTQRILDVGQTPETESAANTYAIAIQAGAILAVVVLYWRRILSIVQGLVGRDVAGRRVLVGLVLATLPAVVVALAFEDVIKDVLLGAWPVVIAWAVGGVAILVLAPRWEQDRGDTELDDLQPRQALVIGVVQILALWPGTSRSLVTILAALATGLTLGAAVEFSFLLGLVVLGGATAYEAASNGSELVDTFGWASPLVGLAAAFVSAIVAVRWMVEYLKSHGLAVFGWYRLGVAAVVAVLLVAGVI